MKKFNNIEEVNKNFKDTLYRKIKEEDRQTIANGNFKIGIDYFIEQLNNFDKKCIVGLSIKETFIIRQFFGFNENNIAYTFDEIVKNYNIKETRDSLGRSIYSISKIIRNIREVLYKELKVEKEVNKILLGELELPTKVFNTLHTHGIYTIGDLIKYSRNSILSMKNVGPSTMKAIDQVLKTLGVDYSSNLTNEDKEHIVESESTISSELRKKRRKLKIKILGIEYQKILLQYERIENEKRKIEQEIEKLLIENAREVKITR